MTSENPATSERRRRQAALAAMTLVQATAAFFFVSDAFLDLSGGGIDGHTLVESLIALGLAAGTVFGIFEVIRIHRLLRSQQRAIDVASGALGEVIRRQFDDWALTPAEREVAYLALKGFDNAEIAGLRGAAVGTVRAQMTHIYQKAGVSGRAQFAAWFVEDLLHDRLPDGREADAA